MDKAKIKLSIIFALAAIAVIVSGIALAQPGKERIPAQTQGGATVVVPSHAVEIAPDVFSLGTATDVDGKTVEGYMFIHRKQGNAQPPWAGGAKNGGGLKCYTFLANGAKWKTNEPYIVDPTNTRGLDISFVASNLAADIGKWETASGFNILGDEIEGIVDGADTSSPDDKNEVYFGNVDSAGAIAVTIVWGIFSGPPSQRKLVEWDQVYDQVDYGWSSAGEAGKMDFENIATHELGHSVGMGHPPSECTEETMYAYAGFGETKKRDLNAGDIAGINELY